MPLALSKHYHFYLKYKLDSYYWNHF